MDNKKILVGFTTIILLGAGAGTVFLLNRPSSTNDTDNSRELSVSPITDSSSTYKDGTYTAEGQYQTPAGSERIGVTITLQNSIVTDLKMTHYAKESDSKRYQSAFSSGINTLVVGKKLGTLNTNRVSGSSLTSQGFNEAVRKIMNEAKDL